MEPRKGKIGINTLFFIFLAITFSPVSRLFMNYTAQKAGQANWLTPIPAGIIFYYFLRRLNVLVVNHPGLSLMEIYEKITGKFLAKIISVVYVLWIMVLLGINLSTSSFRLTNTLYPNIDDNIFIAILLVTIGGLFLPSGIAVVSRMLKVFFWIIGLGIIFLLGLITPNVQYEQLLPISYLDAIPVLKGSVVIVYIWTLITIMLIWADDVIGTKEFKKSSNYLLMILIIVTIALLAICTGSSNSYIMKNSVYPLLIIVEDIMLLDAIQGFDAILVVLWTFSDIALVTCLSMSCIKLIKYIFNLEDASIYINVFTILVYYVTLITTKSQFELANTQSDYSYYFSIGLFAVIPIIMSWIYKIRLKASKALLKSQRNN